MSAYSILTNLPVEHHHQLFLAEAEDVPGRLEFNLALIAGERPDPPLPVLPIRLDAKGPRLDYIGIANLRADLCSQRFVDVLASQQVPFIAYQARVVDPRTEESLSDRYWVWRPVTIADAIDWERSKYGIHPVFQRRELSEVVLSEECLQAAPPLFSAPKYSEWIIRNDVGDQLVHAGITGMEFYPLTMPLYQRAQLGRRITHGEASPKATDP